MQSKAQSEAGSNVMDRPLRYVHEEEEVYLLVTALISQEDGTACLGIQPQNEATATLAVLEDALTDIASPTLNLGVSPVR